jgi:P4 family phage/plasmid primase-like protien
MRVDGKVAYEFLQWLGNGRASVYMLTSGGMVYRTVNEESITQVLLAGNNTYYSAAICDPKVNRKAKKEALLSTHFLHVDIDPLKGADPAKEQERIMRLLEIDRPSDVPQPSAVVFSGRGYQALWKLKKDVKLPENEEAIEAANIWLMKRLGAPAGTHNTDRLLRLPGSWNPLDEKKIRDGYTPAQAELVYMNDHAYDLDEFGRAQTKAQQEQIEASADEIIAKPRMISAEELETLKLPRRIEWLIARGNPARHLKEYEQDYGKCDKDPNDRNVWVLDVVCNMVRKGVPDDIMLGVLLDPEWGISAHCLDQKTPEPYARRQVARAKAFVAKDKPREEFDLKTDELIGAPKKVKKAIQEWRKTALLDDEDAVIQWLAGKLGPKAKGVVQTQLGEKYVPLLPKIDKPTINGKNLPEMVAAVTNKIPHIKCCENELYLYENGKYRHCPTVEFNVLVQRVLSEYVVVTGMGTKDPKVGLHQHHVDEITKHFLRNNDTERSDDGVILFRNGYLKDGQFYPSDPSVFLTGGPDCDYVPTATCPEWETFLQSQWQEDPASINLLQEMMGLLMTDDVSRQTCFLLVGPPRSGKGITIRMIERMIGSEYFASFSMTNLASDFGLESFIGKTVAAAADIRGPFDSKTKAKARELILGISGGDAQSINRKGKTILTTTLRVRLVMSFNELEDARAVLIDGKGATASRLKTLLMTQSFAGREDVGLEKRLAAELPGIVNWAIKGLERLRAQGFTNNDATQAIREATKQTTVKDFTDEYTIEYPCKPSEIWAVYNTWASERGIKAAPLNWFTSQIRDADADVKYTEHQQRCCVSSCNNRFRLLYKGDKPEDRSLPCKTHEHPKEEAF